MKSCMTCGMPLVGAHENDIGLETPEGTVCTYDIADGKIKSADEIFDGGVAFFAAEACDGDMALAEHLTRKNMAALPYWQTHPFAKLDGAQATNEEFGAAMMKL